MDAIDADAAEAEIDMATVAEISAWSGAAQKRQGARSANLAMSLIVRGLIIFIAFAFVVNDALGKGGVNQWFALALFAMVADYGRVLRKALRSGAR